MPYHFFDHTGDIGVDLRGGSLEEVFAAATRALAEILVDPDDVLPRVREAVSLEAAAPDLLLVEWLSELLYRFEVRGLLPARPSITVVRAGERWRLKGEAAGDHFDPSRHHTKVLVKAVTYHALRLEPDAGGWAGRVIFDI